MCDLLPSHTVCGFSDEQGLGQQWHLRGCDLGWRHLRGGILETCSVERLPVTASAAVATAALPISLLTYRQARLVRVALRLRCTYDDGRPILHSAFLLRKPAAAPPCLLPLPNSFSDPSSSPSPVTLTRRLTCRLNSGQAV
jgi:hypothetical protein